MFLLNVRPPVTNEKLCDSTSDAVSSLKFILESPTDGPVETNWTEKTNVWWCPGAQTDFVPQSP